MAPLASPLRWGLLGWVLCGLACIYEPIRPKAAHDLGCASDKLDILEREDGNFDVVGCGKRATYYCEIDNRGQQRCEQVVRTEAQETRYAAAQALGCSFSDLTIDKIGDGLYRASGCDRAASFACKPREQGKGHRCALRPSAPPAASQPPPSRP